MNKKRNYLIYILSLSVFSMNTTEAMTAGILPMLSDFFRVSLTEAGRLITYYALSMAIGGPILVVLMRRFELRRSLIVLLISFILGQTICIFSNVYWVLVMGRSITAIATSAFFGVAAASCVAIAGEGRRIWALSLTFSGLMVAQVIGVPIATAIAQYLGWQSSFILVDLLCIICLFFIIKFIPKLGSVGAIDLFTELRVFKNRRLWLAYSTNALQLAAVYAVFSYISPILTELSGFSEKSVPWILFIYGLSTIFGAYLVGKFAENRSSVALFLAQLILSISMFLMLYFFDSKIIFIFFIVLFGISGIPLSAARAARVMQFSSNGALVSTFNTSIVNVGISFGSWLSGAVLATRYSYSGPFLVGALLSLIGAGTILIDFFRLGKSSA